MKKVMCYIDMLGRGGAQRVMSNLVTYFSKKGYQVVLVNDYVRDETLPHYDVPDVVTRKYLRKVRGGNPIIKNILRIMALRRMIKAERPDIVLSFLGEPNIRMLVSSFGLRCKKVVSVRNDPNKEYGSGLFRKLIANFLFLLADGVVFQTKDAADYFFKRIQEKSRIILNPVNTAMYSDKTEGERRNVITLGRLEPQKNHKMLIDAFRNIADEFPDENLYIYGDGPLREKTEEYIKSLGLESRILLPGNISDVKKALMDSKLFVLSSDYEGLPNALMESMATATPSISTDCPCGGPKTLIQNEEQGILVPVGDTKAMSEAMRKLLQDKPLRRVIGKNVRERAEAFRDEVVYKQWEEYFLEVASK